MTVPVAGADGGVSGGAGEMGVLPTYSELEHFDDEDDGDGDGDDPDSESDSDDSDDAHDGASGARPAGETPARRSPPQPAAAPPVAARSLVRPHLLRPARGRIVGSLRPTLRWRHHGRGVRLYNVQIFLRGKKVMSVFPRSRAYRVPARRLGHGRQYVWRVWPRRAGRGYTAKPLAVGWFATPRRAPAAR